MRVTECISCACVCVTNNMKEIVCAGFLVDGSWLIKNDIDVRRDR